MMKQVVTGPQELCSSWGLRLTASSCPQNSASDAIRAYKMAHGLNVLDLTRVFDKA